MKALLQRVLSASVAVEGEVVGAIDRGYVVLLGVAPDDGDAQIEWLVDKVLSLRVFANEQGKIRLQPAPDWWLGVASVTVYAAGRYPTRPSTVV